MHDLPAQGPRSCWPLAVEQFSCSYQEYPECSGFNQALNILYHFVWHFPNEPILAQFIISLSSDCGVVLFSFPLGVLFVTVFVFVSFFVPVLKYVFSLSATK